MSADQNVSGRRHLLALFTTALLLVTASGVSAATIEFGTYRLHNHPDGQARPPSYGLRLDGLLDSPPTATPNIYTFDFDAAGAAMWMDYSAPAGIAQIHIYGTAWGGKDAGLEYEDPQFWAIDFLYNIGVELVGSDGGLGDVWARPTPDGQNTGTITGLGPVTTTFFLFDFSGDFGYTFRLGDMEGPPEFLRFFPGISGTGWLQYSTTDEFPKAYVGASDWLFTAEPVSVPEPGLLTLLGFGLAMVARRKYSRPRDRGAPRPPPTDR